MVARTIHPIGYFTTQAFPQSRDLEERFGWDLGGLPSVDQAALAAFLGFCIYRFYSGDLSKLLR